jgi:diacylglycerol kinase
MRNKIHKHGISVRHALEGVAWALKTQPNYQIHIVLSIIALVGAYVYNISQYELLMIILLISVGLAIETVNTSIERAADAIDTQWREDIKQTKDLAAGAMLLFAIGAVVIAGMIFLPRMLVF